MKSTLFFTVALLFSLPAISKPAITSNLQITHTINFQSGVNKKLVKDWSLSLDKISTSRSTTYIRKKNGGKDNLHISKHRDVIVWIPESTNLSKKTNVVLWFHGHYGFFRKRTFEDRTLKQLVPLTSEKNFVLVIPEMPWSIHTRTPSKRNGMLWVKKEGFLSFINQIENILHSHLKISSRDSLGSLQYKVVGHSAGGSTIRRLSVNGGICAINTNLVVWSDSSYGSWLKNAWEGCLGKSGIKVKVIVSKGDSPWRQASLFKNSLNKIPENLEFLVMKKPRWTHKIIGDNAVKISKLLEDI